MCLIETGEGALVTLMETLVQRPFFKNGEPR
jgi:hypothetical protein